MEFYKLYFQNVFVELNHIEKNGYFLSKNLCDPKKLYHELPKERGTLKWFGKKLSNYKNYGVEPFQFSVNEICIEKLYESFRRKLG